MSSPVADGVLAATHKLVQQAMTGQWQDVPKTVAERRVLLERLSATAAPADQSWLSALKQAMAESDAAVAKMAKVAPSFLASGQGHAGQGVAAATGQPVDAVMDMIRQGR